MIDNGRFIREALGKCTVVAEFEDKISAWAYNSLKNSFPI
jgi:hypothetical protein